MVLITITPASLNMIDNIIWNHIEEYSNLVSQNWFFLEIIKKDTLIPQLAAQFCLHKYEFIAKSFIVYFITWFGGFAFE